MSQPAFRHGLWSPTSSRYLPPTLPVSTEHQLRAAGALWPPASSTAPATHPHGHRAPCWRTGGRRAALALPILQPQWPWEGGHHHSARPPWSSWKGTGGTSWLQSPPHSPAGCSLTAMEVIDPELPRSRGQHGKAAGGLQLGHTKAVMSLLMATRNE